MKKALIKLLVLAFMLSAMACFGVGCAHEHSFDKQDTSIKYISKEATCLEVAEYYYSCSCGEKGDKTFEYGEPLGHDYGEWTSNNNDTHTRICSRDATHTETGDCSGGTATCAEKAICDTCGGGHGQKEAHVFDQQVVSDEYKIKGATCTEPAKYFYSCVCGEKSSTIFFSDGEALGHNWRPWSKEYLASNSHSRTCYRCSEGYESERCYGGTATCTEKAVCEVCKTNYGSALGHSWGAWTSNGNDQHTRICANDSTHVETQNCSGGEAPCTEKSICSTCHTEYGEIEGHSYGKWLSIGGGKHKRVCAHNSSHTQTEDCSGGKATCTERAVCEYCKANYDSALGHSWGAWTSNGNDQHTRICANDSTHVETQNCSGGEAPCTEKSICSTCHTEYGEILGHNYGKWYSNGNDTHIRYCSRDSRHYETGDCAGGTPTCYKQAVCDTCGSGHGAMLEHDYGEYVHYSNATCVDYAKQRAKCKNQGCSAYLERDDLTQPPKGSHDYNAYDNCKDCGEKRQTSVGLVYTKIGGENYYMLSSLGDCTDTEIVIAQYVSGYFVTKITDEYGRGVFDYGGGWSSSYKQALSKITKITIPKTINYIEKNTFRQLPALETVIIEGNYVVIEEGAFYRCPELKNVIILGESVEIGASAFYQCSKLESVEIGENGYLSKIGQSAFSGCKILKGVELKSGLTEIGNYAFTETAFESVVIPNTTKTIGNGVFSGCKNLRSAMFKGTVSSFGTSVFSRCSTLTDVKLPNNLNSIPNSTFAECTMLNKVDIPSGITSIGSYAFDTTSLVSITIPSGVSSIGSYAFRYCYKLYEVVNNSSLSIKTGETQNGYIGYYAVLIHKGNSKVVNQNDFLFITDKGQNYLLGYVGLETEITLPENFNGQEYSIYQYAFNGCSPLTKITLTDGVNAIGEKAFEKCSDGIFNIKDGVKYLGTATNPYYAVIGYVEKTLTTCALEESAKVIADKAFYGCASLSTATVPSGLKHFGYSAFDNCGTLTYNVKDGVKYLGDATNNYLVVIGVDNKTLTSYDVEEGAKFINYAAFWTCEQAISINLPNSIIYIEQSAFGFCSRLQSMVIPNGIKVLGDTIFNQCRALTSVQIPESVVAIGYRAFYECYNLKTLTLPSGLVSIGDEAFYNCGNLQSIEIPDGITSLGKLAFYQCSSLKSIVLPKSIGSIGATCFYRCGYFKTVYYKGTAEDWNKITIEDDRDTYLARATKYYYIENEQDLPTDGGNYWHYVDGVPTAW